MSTPETAHSLVPARDEPVAVTRSRPGMIELLARYVWVVNGHSHRRSVTHVDSTTYINAGTLVEADGAWFGIVDFDDRVVRYFVFDDGLSVAPAEEVPLVREKEPVSPSERDTRPPPAPATAWTVTVTYREPTYERARSLPPTAFRASYVVHAASEREATDMAIGEFRGAVRDQTVGWAREVVRVDARRGASR